MKQYHIERNGQQYGPFSADQIIEMLQSGQLSVSDNCWHEGMPEWNSLGSVFNLSTIVTSPPVPTHPRVKVAVKYHFSTFGDRMGAYIIDYLIFNILMWTMLIVAAFCVDAMFGMSDSLWTLMLMSSALCLWLYYAFFEASQMQGTPGKRACCLVVCDMNGQRITFWKATGRYFGKFISFLTLGIGFLMCNFTKKHQCLHDMMSGCQVLKRGK